MALLAEHVEKLRSKYGVEPGNLNGILESLTPEEASKMLAFRVDSGGLLIRYPGVEAFSIRLDQPPLQNGKPLKYLRPKGQKNALFIPPGFDVEQASEIWITEGELKALAASQRALPVCALSGVWNWRSDIDQEDPEAVAATLAIGKAPDGHALIDGLKRDWGGRKFVLIYDSDIDQGHRAWPAFPRLAEQLYAHGAAEVKVLTLPPLLEEGKTGIDDFLLLREKEGHDAAAELRAMVAQAPAWLPMADGAEKYAQHLLEDPNPANVARAAAALLAAKGELAAKEITNRLKGQDMQRTAWREAKRILEEARRLQRPAQGENLVPSFTRTLISAFPELADVIQADAPFPDPPDGGARWDIRDGKIVLISYRQVGQEPIEVVSVAVDTVAVLTRRLVPLEENSDIEKWEVAWWEPAQRIWRRAHVPASWLFDSGQKKYLIEIGVPISSENADKAVLWFHTYRMAVMGGQIRIPTTRTVSRCGWFTRDDGVAFALGRTIIRPQGQEDARPADSVANGDIVWAQDLSHNEIQIIESFGIGGDPTAHREGLLEAVIKYPQVAFGVGCAAGAPLLKFAQSAGLSEVAGFTVLMHGGDAGRRGRQGKTTWSQVVASFFGPPEPGQRLRYADRTRVQMGVLLSTASDLPIHIEDLQKIAREAKKATTEEIDYLLHLVAAGMDRERGSRAGGGRLTKTFRSVVLATAEYDVTAAIPAGSGAHDRILKLPPLFPVDGDQYRREAERLARLAGTNYGYAGKDYLTWLVGQVQQNRAAVIEAIQKSIFALQNRLPDDERRGSAGRLAKRAGIALAGLALWLESIAAKDDAANGALDSFYQAWEMVVKQIPTEDLAETVLQIVRSYVSEYRELIHGYRDANAPAPSKWVGATATVNGQKCVVLFENGLAETVEERGIDFEMAKKALATTNSILSAVEGGKKRLQVKVRKSDFVARGLAFPLRLIEEED